MDSREARAQAPTAAGGDGGLGLLHDLRSAYLSGDRHESQEHRQERMYRLIAARRDEVTVTLMLMLHDGDPIAYLLNCALLGMRYNKDSEHDIEHAAPPLHEAIVLQSLRMRCQLCDQRGERNCGRKGKRHDVVYKTGVKSGTGAEHRMIEAMGGTVDTNVLCRVDPDTGLFSLPPLEAKKALRQWGEFAVRAPRRFVNREARKGDRWLIREVRHFELYANAGPLTGIVQQDNAAMTPVD